MSLSRILSINLEIRAVAREVISSQDRSMMDRLWDLLEEIYSQMEMRDRLESLKGSLDDIIPLAVVVKVVLTNLSEDLADYIFAEARYLS